MGRKSRSKFNRMLRPKPATSAPDGRRADRERMKRVLWKMVERYEQDLSASEGKPVVSGSQALSAMRMLREIDKEEAAEANAAASEDGQHASTEPKRFFEDAMPNFAQTAPQESARKEQAEAEQSAA